MKKLLFFASAVALLASCSQDLTGDYAPSMKSGKTKIVAYNSVGDNTRTHLDEKEGGKFEYGWDAGDAIGLFSAKADDDTNAYFGYTGNNVFEGDLKAVAEETYYAYYPWDRAAALDGTELTMYINAKQKYNHKNSSFAATEAPAVAHGVAPAEGEEFKLTFTNLATYIRVPLVGVGKVKTLTLAMGTAKKGTAARKEVLNGSFEVDFEGDDLGVYTVTGTKEGGTNRKFYTTLDCGQGVDLDPKKPAFFWFVIPAGIEITEGEFANFWVNLDDDFPTTTLEADFSYAFSARTTQNNQVLKLADYDEGDKDKEYAYTWYEGDAYVIIEKFDFIKYAYAATYGIEGAPKEMLDADGNLRPAMIIEHLDFTGYDPDKDIKLSEADQYSAFDQAVVKAYKENEFSVATIGEGEKAVAYSIEGNVKEGNVNGKAAVITGLKFNGPVFGHSKYSSVKNITLAACEVTTDKSYFLTDNPYLGTDAAHNYFEEFVVTVKGGTMNSTATGSKAIFNKIYSRDLAKGEVSTVTVDGYPTGVTKFAKELTINEKKVVSLSDAYVTATDMRFDVIDANGSGEGALANIEAGAEGAKMVANQVPADSEWFSVVTGYDADKKVVEASYWTGRTAKQDNADGIYTAEEFAYEAQQTAAATIELTNHIDLMDKAWPEVKAATVTINSKQPTPAGATATVYTISNVKIDDVVKAPAQPARQYYTLFGHEACVKNVKVENITITVNNDTKVADVVVASLAGAHTGTGTANANVNVTGLTINEIAANVKLLDEVYGGLYHHCSAPFGLSMIVDTKVAFNGATPTAEGFGSLVGYINVTLKDSDAKNTVEIDFTGVPAEKPFGKLNVAIPEQAKEGKLYTDLRFKGVTSLDSDIFNFTGDKSHTVFVYFGTNTNYTYVFSEGELKK